MNLSTPAFPVITNSRSSLRLTFIELVMPSSHLILWRPLLLLPPIPPSIRVFSNESTLHMRWPKYWSFSFSIIPSKEIPGLISLSHFSSVQLCVTLWTAAHPGSSVHGIAQARLLEWVAVPFSRGSCHPGIKSSSLMSPALAGRFFTTSTTWEAPVTVREH